MTTGAREDERLAAATVGVALEQVRARSPAAAQLLAVCSFLAADDIPRRMLYGSADQLPEGLKAAISDPGGLQEVVEILVRYALVHVVGDGVWVHRTRQSVVRRGLGEDERAQWASGAARVVLASLPERPHDSRNWPWTARLLPHASTVADHLDDLGIEPLLAARLRDGAACYLVSQGQLDTAEGLLESALERVQEAEPRGSLHGTILNHLANAECELGLFNLAKEHVHEALGIHQAQHSKPEPSAGHRDPDAKRGVEVRTAMHPDIAADLESLGEVALRQGDLADALELLRHAYHMRVELHGDRDPAVAGPLVGLFKVLVEKGCLEEAADTLERAIGIRRAAYGERDHEVMVNREIRLMIDEPNDRDLRAREALRVSEDVFGPRHPRTADTCRLLGGLLRHLGQLDEARKMGNLALDIDRGNFGSSHYRVGMRLASLIPVDVAVGDVDAAARGLQQVAEVITSARPGERVAALRNARVGDALVDVARLDGGAPLLERALAIFDAAFADDDELLHFAREQLAKAHVVRGDVLLVEGNTDEAVLEYEGGLRVALLTDENQLDDARFHARLALVRARDGDTASMAEHFRAAVECLERAGNPAPLWYVVFECSRLCGLLGRMPTVEQALAEMFNEAMEGGAVDEFRGRLTAGIPPDWFAKESTTMLASDGQANVIASSEPIDPSIGTDEYANVQGELLRSEFDGYKEHAFERVTIFGGRSGFLRHFEWAPPDGVPVTQLQLYHVENGRGYTATATTPTHEFPERELLLREILLALRIAD